MALDTYTGLKDAIARWLRRSDLTTAIPDFITLAEKRFNRKLSLKIMETSVTGTTSGSSIAKPADLRELQRIVIYSGGREFELSYAPQKELSRFIGESRMPVCYAEQKKAYYLGPKPDSAYSYELFYVARVPALSDVATTNDLLTTAPDVYLYGSLLEAEPYLKNDSRIATWATAFQTAVDDIQGVNDQKQRSSLTVRSDVRL